ncbi:hypothetical protein T4A_3834 [Trichinella pseudospiralis]|uniref:Uncharacterized protein n=1 Tax=Trichinella pseudospiralis TaxID=6337 RepID=A0A0V1CXB6_TRIPS|nr:hypothetical protein T4A_3834 [Trichinella pseudospiralis]
MHVTLEHCVIKLDIMTDSKECYTMLSNVRTV